MDDETAGGMLGDGAVENLPSIMANNKKGLCARICKNVHVTGLSGRRVFSLRGPPNNTFSPEWPRNRGLAVEMALRGRNDRTSTTTVLPALGAWKPAKDAGSHIPTATATAAVKLDATGKPAQIQRFYRFSSRTVKSSLTKPSLDNDLANLSENPIKMRLPRILFRSCPHA